MPLAKGSGVRRLAAALVSELARVAYRDSKCVRGFAKTPQPTVTQASNPAKPAFFPSCLSPLTPQTSAA